MGGASSQPKMVSAAVSDVEPQTSTKEAPPQNAAAIPNPGKGDQLNGHSDSSILELVVASSPESNPTSGSGSEEDPSPAATLDELQLDSAVSQQFVDEITTITPDPEDSVAEPQILTPESDGNPGTLEVSLVTPSNPDLTHWVAVEDWTDRSHWFKQGDLVEFHRPLYSHWGIYMGQGLIAHVTTYDLLNGSSNILRTLTTTSAFLPSVAQHPIAATAATMGGIAITLGEMILKPSPPAGYSEPNAYYCRLDPIDVVAGGRQFRVNNLVHRAKGFAVRTWEETFRLVHSKVNRVHQYCLRSSNCEHVATFFRYKAKEVAERPAKKARATEKL